MDKIMALEALNAGINIHNKRMNPLLPKLGNLPKQPGFRLGIPTAL